MLARLASLLVWSLVAASVVAWGLRLAARGEPVPAHAATAQMAGLVALGDVSRLLGTPPRSDVPAVEAAAPAADARFKLVGVVAPRAGAVDGLALIAIDGKPARAWRQGAEVEPGLRLLQVDHRHASLGPEPGNPTLTLELPPVAEAARGRPGEAGVVATALPPVMGVPPAAPAGAVNPAALPMANAGAGAGGGAGLRGAGRMVSVPAGLAPGASPGMKAVGQGGEAGGDAGQPDAGAIPNGAPPQNFH